MSLPASSSGNAYRCVLQQCNVGALLSGVNAVAHPEGKHLPPISQARKGYMLNHLRRTSNHMLFFLCFCFFAHTDIMDYADNNGNLSHRNFECSRQYIYWPGNLRACSVILQHCFFVSVFF